MIRTVDVVIAGSAGFVFAPAVSALERGGRVLVVVRGDNTAEVRRLGQRLRKAAGARRPQLFVMTNAEVVCVDGVGGVEAVVIRYVRTGRLCAVNASALLTCD